MGKEMIAEILRFRFLRRHALDNVAHTMLGPHPEILRTRTFGNLLEAHKAHPELFLNERTQCRDGILWPLHPTTLLAISSNPCRTTTPKRINAQAIPAPKNETKTMALPISFARPESSW